MNDIIKLRIFNSIETFFLAYGLSIIIFDMRNSFTLLVWCGILMAISINIGDIIHYMYYIWKWNRTNE